MSSIELRSWKSSSQPLSRLSGSLLLSLAQLACVCKFLSPPDVVAWAGDPSTLPRWQKPGSWRELVKASFKLLGGFQDIGCVVYESQHSGARVGSKPT